MSHRLKLTPLFQVPLRALCLLAFLCLGLAWKLRRDYPPVRALDVIPGTPIIATDLTLGPDQLKDRRLDLTEDAQDLVIDLAFAWKGLPKPIRKAWIRWMQSDGPRGELAGRDLETLCVLARKDLSVDEQRLIQTSLERIHASQAATEKMECAFPGYSSAYMDIVHPAHSDHVRPMFLSALLAFTLIIALRNWTLRKARERLLLRLGF